MQTMASQGVYICTLSQADKEYAAVNLNESDTERAKKIADIRQWITQEEGLYARNDDFSILRFLRACKFDIEKTKTKLGNYYRQRDFIPEWYRNKDPFLPELQEMFNMGVFLPLRNLDEEGRMIVFVRTAIHDPARHNQADVLKASLMILDFATRDHEQVTIHGIKAILDMEGVTLGHALQLTPTVIKKLVHAWQGCYPLRIQSLDFINAPIYVNVVLNIFKSFMNAKLKRRVHVHRRGAKLVTKNIPATILPVEYGGTNGTITDLIEYWKARVEENRDWFAEDEKYKYESKE